MLSFFKREYEWIFIVKYIDLGSSNLKVISSNTHFENILAYYLDDKKSEEQKIEDLSDTEKELKKRWEAAFMSMLEFRSQGDTVKKLVEVFGISQATAYRDIQQSELLFGSFKRFDKEAWRYIQIERKHKLYQLALKDKNLELAHKIDGSIDKLLGLDKEENPYNPEKIAAQNYEINISKQHTKLIKHIISSGGAVNMNVPDVVDIDFEEINNTDA